MSLKRKHEEVEARATVALPSGRSSSQGKLFESEPIEDRSSKFIGLFSPDVNPERLQAHHAFKSASHRMLAWRRPSKQKSSASTLSKAPAKVIYETGFDDDGEKYGGKKLEKVLIELNVEGTVVVARWYGGVLLGPVRFDHIANVAKEAISQWKESTEPPSKKLKEEVEKTLTPEQEQELKQRLVKQLQDRDNSINVLRDLLAEKKALGGNDGSPKKPTSITSTQDYANMPVAKLRVLEKARDQTISWILKQIDAIEASQKSSKSNDQA